MTLKDAISLALCNRARFIYQSSEVAYMHKINALG